MLVHSAPCSCILNYNKTIRELYNTWIFPELGFFVGFSLYFIYFPRGSATLRWAGLGSTAPRFCALTQGLWKIKFFKYALRHRILLYRLETFCESQKYSRTFSVFIVFAHLFKLSVSKYVNSWSQLRNFIFVREKKDSEWDYCTFSQEVSGT